MKPWVRAGATVALILLASPFVVALSLNPLLVFPLWSAVSYWAYRKVFRKQDVAAGALAVLTGQLAFEIYIVAYGAGNPTVSALHLLLLVLSIAWLYLSQSALTIVLLATSQFLALAFTLFALSKVVFSAYAGDADLLIATVGGGATPIIGYVLEIGFLIALLLSKRKAGLAGAAA